eukprot:5170556-Pleurochrysis_carterae.AAC.3
MAIRTCKTEDLDIRTSKTERAIRTSLSSSRPLVADLDLHSSFSRSLSFLLPDLSPPSIPTLLSQSLSASCESLAYLYVRARLGLPIHAHAPVCPGTDRCADGHSCTLTVTPLALPSRDLSLSFTLSLPLPSMTPPASIARVSSPPPPPLLSIFLRCVDAFHPRITALHFVIPISTRQFVSVPAPCPEF